MQGPRENRPSAPFFAILSLLAFVVRLCGAAGAEEIRAAIFVVKPDGTQVRKVVQIPDCGEHGSPRWSHDGKRLAFDAVHTPTNTKRLYVVNIDGTGLKQIGDGSMPDWSPDDKQMVFWNQGEQSVYVQNVDGQGRTRLAAGASPRWSPDGSKIAFTDIRNLKVLDLLSGQESVLLDAPVQALLIGFDWSPDGKRLAFVAWRNGQRELIFVSAEGESKGMELRMTRNFDGHISWSPNGKQLACALGRLLQIVDVDGTSARQIPEQRGASNDAAWSPDGKWLAFAGDAKRDAKAKSTPLTETK